MAQRETALHCRLMTTTPHTSSLRITDITYAGAPPQSGPSFSVPGARSLWSPSAWAFCITSPEPQRAARLRVQVITPGYSSRIPVRMSALAEALLRDYPLPE